MRSQRFHVQLRAEVTGDTLAGHAAVFGQTARLPGHDERVGPGAFDAVLESPATDVRALFNHEPNLLLGRQSAGTLRMGTDSEGLEFEADLPDTTYARDLRELVERGDLTGASFAFIPGKDSWDTVPGGRQRRTHTSVRELIDVSAVTFPAYDTAAVSLRHIEYARSGRSQLIRARARLLRPGGATHDR